MNNVFPPCRELNRVMQLDAGDPEQFCVTFGAPGVFLFVSAFPVAWRVEIAHDERYPGSEYVR